MLRMAPSFMPFFTKLLLLNFLVSILPLAHRCSANPTTAKEQTFALIKPDGVSGNYTGAIKKIILDSGFSITREVLVQLDEDTVRNFYAEHSKRSFFPSLVQYMTSGPVLVMVLEKVNAIADWRALIGPTDAGLAKVTHPQSIRAMCGLDKQRNCVHGSDSPLSAAREISFFITKSLTGDHSCKIWRFGKKYTPPVSEDPVEDELVNIKFFNWMQSKLNGGQQNRKCNTVPVPAAYHAKQEPNKDEKNDWSHGLLTIGTLGNTDPQENTGSQRFQNTENEVIQEEEGSSSPDLAEFSPEEVGQLQKELTKLLKRKPASKAEAENADLPLDRFLNCPSSLEVDRTISNRFSTYSDDKDEEDIDRTIRVIIGRCKEVCMENKKKAIGKKSISFLLKKMFVCRSGFAPTPSLRDALQESRMEKLLRTMLSKKIYTQTASRTSSMKRYLEDRPHPKTKKDDDESQEEKRKGCKWVKTDSEYIVLDLD